jgi:AGZA family xanthine/uracil permease-like MFS transporter
MGGRSAYTLATAFFVGGAGVIGYFGLLYDWIPLPAILPILIFVGIEITAQSFEATPKKHYAAVVFACIPALAYLATLMTKSVFDDLGKSLDSLSAPLAGQLFAARALSNGFIVTSLLWGGLLAALIDRKLKVAAIYCLVAATFSLFGVIHSPFEEATLALPWLISELPEYASLQTPYWIAGAYLEIAILFYVWQLWLDHNPPGRPRSENKPAKGKTEESPSKGIEGARTR